MTRQEIEDKLHLFVEHFHNKDRDAAAAMFAEDGQAQHWTGERIVGRAAIHAALEPFFAEGQSIHYDVERVDVDESANVAWSIWTATMTNPQGAVIMKGVDTFEFADGLIVRNAVFMQTAAPTIVPA